MSKQQQKRKKTALATRITIRKIVWETEDFPFFITSFTPRKINHNNSNNYYYYEAM